MKGELSGWSLVACGIIGACGLNLDDFDYVKYQIGYNGKSLCDHYTVSI